jgi:ABC-2 type transport system ATP-binding protein
MTPIIETTDLTKHFQPGGGLRAFFRGLPAAPKKAVDGVTLQVGEGEVFGLLGPNGAGKTTVIKMLCTLLLPSSGTAVVGGHDVVREGRAVRGKIGLVASDERSFYWRLTGRQNLRFFASLHRLHGKEAERRIDALADAMALGEVLDQRFNRYSTGMRQRLAIARGLLTDPPILIMDEPTKGVDPINGHALLSLIRERVSGVFKKTVLITTHILSEAEQVCDRVAIMSQGSVLACGTIGEIRRSVRSEEKYLLQISGCTEAFIQDVSRLKGVTRCVQQGKNNGSMMLEISVSRGSNAFPELIDRIVQKKGRLLRCTSQENSFEEVFLNLFKDQKEVGRG